MVTVSVRYFAVLRDRRGLSTERIETAAFTVRELANQLTVAHQLDLPASMIRLAVNGAFVSDDEPLCEGDEVVLLPPVAGG